MSAPRGLRPGLALFFLLPSLAVAQSDPPDGPDVPPGDATIIGRLVHETRPEAAAGIGVLLYALASDGSGGLRQTVTDDDGGFRFDGVSNAPDVVYLVGARAGEIPFGSRFVFAPGEREHRIEVALSDPVTDAAAIARGDVDVRIERGCTHLRVSHSHTVTNPGESVIFVPTAARASAAPIFEAIIPENAEGFESLLGREGVEREGTRVRFWGPVYPGTQQVEFGYGLAMDTERFALGLPEGAPKLRVLAPEGILDVSGEGLEPAPALTLGEQRYAVREASEWPAARSVALAVVSSPREPTPIHTPRAEMWLELDDAALEVNERLEVVVDAEGGVPESLAEPILCMPLPTGALELRFSSDTLSAGLRRDPSGDLAIHGPLPAGSTSLAVSYRLPATGAGARLERRYDRALPLLSVLVADNGVIPETSRLHRRRAVRSADRMYLHLEAFAVEPLEPVVLGLRRTAPRSADTGWASAGFAVLAGLAALGFLSAPLRGDAPDPVASKAPDAAALERLAIVRALEDLEDDLETGKLTPEDHAVMRNELRSRAAARLLRPSEPAPEEAAPEVAPTTCPACARAARPGDAFCSGCGAKLQAGAASA